MARDSKYDALFEPVRIGPHSAKNRFYAVPHCNDAGSDRPGAQAAFRGMKAEGGWAVVNTEYCSISPENDDGPFLSARLWDDGDIINLRAMCDAVHAHGALAGVELWAGGSFASGGEGNAVPRGPSGGFPSGYSSIYAHEMDEADIADVIGDYVAAANRARDAGFDHIELECSDSDLPTQFFMPTHNHRTDGYGGSFENRARFWLELLEALKTAIGGECSLGLRYSADNLRGPGGVELPENLRFAEVVDRHGLCDLWDVKVSDAEAWGDDSGPSRFYKSHWLGWAAKAVKGVVRAPVVQVGRLTSPDDMLAAIRNGEADLIGAARPSIADPFLPRKIEEGRFDDIRECIGCNICVASFHQQRPLLCTQNATVLEEYRRGWHPEKFAPAAEPCSVLVVGAGPAGLECARVLGEQNYDVHLCEAKAEPGGTIRDVMRYPGLAEWGRIVSWRVTQIAKLSSVELHTGVGEMSADDVLGYGADKVIIATGARWRSDGLSAINRAPLPGVVADDLRVLTPEQVMAGAQTGERICVLDADGYFTGIGMAEHLAAAGKRVTLITPDARAAEFCDYTLEGDNVQRRIREVGITLRANHWVERIETGNALTLYAYHVYDEAAVPTLPPVVGENPRRSLGESEPLECDSLVLVTARQPNDALYRELKARSQDWAAHQVRAVYAVGDCYAPGIPQGAVWQGHRLAREFESVDPMKPLPYIRERRIWGDDTMPTLNR